MPKTRSQSITKTLRSGNILRYAKGLSDEDLGNMNIERKSRTPNVSPKKNK